MSDPGAIRRPMLVDYARLRTDAVRDERQIIYPEGMTVLNDTGAAILELCDGRPIEEIIAELGRRYGDCDVGDDVREFLQMLAEKRLLRDAPDSDTDA